MVKPGTPDEKRAAESVSFDVGYLNTEGGVTITYFDVDGKELGQRVTTGQGIQRIVLSDIGVHRVHIDTTADVAGAAIDNLEVSGI